jgi:catechol 2,3-dioxygenase-like lactoylglutathione lyase family enzyme
VRLDHVQLAMPAGAEEAARGFYGGLLGFTEVAKPQLLAARGGVWFVLDDAALHLGVEEPFVPARKAHPALRVESAAELDALAVALERAGHAVTYDATLPGVRRFYVADPFGNRIEVVSSAPG